MLLSGTWVHVLYAQAVKLLEHKLSHLDWVASLDMLNIFLNMLNIFWIGFTLCLAILIISLG